MFSVIFEVHPDSGRKDEYLGYAKLLKPELEAIEGFVDNERFESRSRPGWVLSLSTWRDEKAVVRWRTQARHNGIQRKGRDAVFSDYHLRVGEVTADTHPPMPLREERFDTTEAGRAKLCTIVELVPEEGRALAGDEYGLLAAIRLARGAPGLVAAEAYASIYDPGKMLVLASWARPEAADGYEPALVADAASTRVRKVRVIRDYAMFDRREATQYYPDAAPR